MFSWSKGQWSEVFSVNEIVHTQIHFSLHVLFVFGPPFSDLASAGKSKIECQNCPLKVNHVPPFDQQAMTWLIRKWMSTSLQNANCRMSVAFPLPFFYCEECKNWQVSILLLLLSLKALHSHRGLGLIQQRLNAYHSRDFSIVQNHDFQTDGTTTVWS